MENNMKTIYQRLEGIESETNRLRNALHTLKTTDIRAYGEIFGELSMDAALRSERIACRLRNLVYTTGSIGKQNYLGQAAEAQGISISRENGILSIMMLGLLPKRKLHTNSAFLHDPLNHALQEYMKGHPFPLYRDCTICFCQIYGSDFPRQRIRDYDNLEFKQILDIIASYILVDDTGLLCDSYHTAETGECHCTAIYIMERAAFPDWMKCREKRRKTISEKS